MNSITHQMKNMIVIVTKNLIQTSIHISIFITMHTSIYVCFYFRIKQVFYKTIINRILELEGAKLPICKVAV